MDFKVTSVKTGTKTRTFTSGLYFNLQLEIGFDEELNLPMCIDLYNLRLQYKDKTIHFPQYKGSDYLAYYIDFKKDEYSSILKQIEKIAKINVNQMQKNALIGGNEDA